MNWALVIAVLAVLGAVTAIGLVTILVRRIDVMAARAVRVDFVCEQHQKAITTILSRLDAQRERLGDLGERVAEFVTKRKERDAEIEMALGELVALRSVLRLVAERNRALLQPGLTKARNA